MCARVCLQRIRAEEKRTGKIATLFGVLRNLKLFLFTAKFLRHDKEIEWNGTKHVKDVKLYINLPAELH